MGKNQINYYRCAASAYKPVPILSMMAPLKWKLRESTLSHSKNSPNSSERFRFPMSAMSQRTLVRGFPLGLERLRASPLLLELRNVALFTAAYLVVYAGARFFAQRTGTRLWLPD